MKRILVTGGTIFVSKYVAEYYVKKGYEVYVLNRNTKEQLPLVKLIEADRHELLDVLKGYHFDIVIDVNAYTGEDVNMLLDALESYDDYVLISSSAVYPENEKQPFNEDTNTGDNKYWGIYGTNKIEAEKALMDRKPDAYILRPPYLYGQMNNVYREAFVFDCALNDRKFYLPKNGDMNLQFFHVEDLCRFIDVILEKKPSNHIFNVGNKESISIRDWVDICYNVAGKKAEFVNVYDDIEQRNYFSFYNYDYKLDVTNQCELMSDTKSLDAGLNEAFIWYKDNMDKVAKKPYFEYIDEKLMKND